MFLLISVTVEADDQCGTQRLALYLSGVQQQEVDCISFCKNMCFLGLAAWYSSKPLACYRKKTGEWLFAKLVKCIQTRTGLKFECISIELKGS